MVKMATNPYEDSAPCFRHEDDGWKQVLEPQYVHHLAPKPPPEVSHPAPKHKDVKQRCVKFAVAAVISLLLLLLLAGILLAYYFSSPCAHGMQCGDGSCVWESQWCDGEKDCPAGQDEANCVRLHGSSFLLQVYSTKGWRSVCYHGWTEQQGRSSCRQMGFSRSTYFKSGQLTTAASHDGVLKVTPDFNPEASILQQLVLSDACPNHSVVTLHCTDCGRGVNSSRASGGTLASPGSWPWQVSLQFAGSHRCGGAVISPYWTVTAAHCVARASSPADWAVYAGIVDPLGTLFNPAHSVSRIIVHEGFSSGTRRNDIALLRLSTPLDLTAGSNVRPVCLPNVGLNITDHQQGWITTFDHTGSEDSSSPYLTEARVSIIDTAECNRSTVFSGKLSAGLFCAREVEAGADMCRTDSGGPLVTLKRGVWWLVGDSVWGGRCTQRNKIGIYGNVTYFLDWIHHQMRKHQYD